MEVSLDKYGRIVIPKSVRERLGLEAGGTLELSVESSEEGGGETVRLQPAGREPLLKEKDGILVFTGRLLEDDYDVVEHLRAARRSRARKLVGLSPTESPQ